MRVRLLTTALLVALVLPIAAHACENPDDTRALIHSALPTPLPDRAVVLEVTFRQGDWRGLNGSGARVRVRHVIHGSIAGRYVLVRLGPFSSSCDYPFGNGRSGTIVGVVIGSEGGVDIVRPVFARRGSGFRLENGYQFPESIGREGTGLTVFGQGS